MELIYSEGGEDSPDILVLMKNISLTNERIKEKRAR
jgi:hypothetical protein